VKRRSLFAGIAALAVGVIAAPALAAASGAKPKFPTGGGFTVDEIDAITNDKLNRYAGAHAHTLTTAELPAHSHSLHVLHDRGSYLERTLNRTYFLTDDGFKAV
jgi:microcystin-dependent protein